MGSRKQPADKRGASHLIYIPSLGILCSDTVVPESQKQWHRPRIGVAVPEYLCHSATYRNGTGPLSGYELRRCSKTACFLG